MEITTSWNDTKSTAQGYLPFAYDPVAEKGPALSVGTNCAVGREEMKLHDKTIMLWQARCLSLAPSTDRHDNCTQDLDAFLGIVAIEIHNKSALDNYKRSFGWDRVG